MYYRKITPATLGKIDQKKLMRSEKPRARHDLGMNWALRRYMKRGYIHELPNRQRLGHEGTGAVTYNSETSRLVRQMDGSTTN